VGFNREPGAPVIRGKGIETEGRSRTKFTSCELRGKLKAEIKGEGGRPGYMFLRAKTAEIVEGG